MFNLLSSRLAALKLAWVVVTLLIPISILGFYFGNEIGGHLASTRSEARALGLAQSVMPGYFNAASGALDREALAAKAEQAARAGENAYARAELEALAAALRGPDATQDFAAIGTFMTALYHKAPLSLDPDRGAFELAGLALAHVPALLTEQRALWAKEAGGTDLQGFGRLMLAFDRSLESLAVIKSGHADAAPLAGRLAQLQAAALQLSGKDATGAGNLQRDIIAAAKSTYEFATSRLADNIALRESQISGRRNTVLWLSLSSIAIGIASALLMFKSSLVRLDDLSTAKTEADTARQDAEDMNSRLTSINNEIISLNSELADKMSRLKDAQTELLRKGRMEQLGQLTATVAHELRNPLGAVRTSAFLLERKLRDKGMGVEAQLQRINNGITRCDSIITQLLDFSRTKQVAATPANLDEWLANIVEEEARRIPAAVTIECHLGLGAREVPFDPARLQRAVINLISNAAEAMVGTGEDPSKFTSPRPVITISTRGDGANAVVEVEDNGPGIPHEILQKIREPLFTTKSFGTGLGVPAVEQIVVQHGGRLDIASEPGQGARFSMFLPFQIPQLEAA